MRALVALVLIAGCRREPAPITRDDPPKQAEPIPTPSEIPFAPPTTIPLELPRVEPAGELLPIAIDASGNVMIDGVLAKTDADILAAAKRAFTRDPATRALITASAAVKHSRVIAVLDQVRLGGITRVGFAIEKSAAP